MSADDLAWGTLLAIMFLGFVVLPGCLWVSNIKDAVRRRKAQEYGEANAYRVTGKVARFGTASSDEYSVRYTLQLEGNSTIYSVDSRFFSSKSRGELTNPSDEVSFTVLPGLGIRDFHNAATAVA